MGFSGVLLAMTAVSAVQQINQGRVAKAEANYNATLVEGKANLIGAQQEIEYGQYQRLKGQHMSKSVANIAGAGVGMSGSAMAVLLNAQTQIGIDQAIGQFNFEQEKQYTFAQADQIRRQGRTALSNSYSNAFSTVLRGASNYAMYTSAGTLKDTTFDAVPGYWGYGKNTPAGVKDMGTYSKLPARR